MTHSKRSGQRRRCVSCNSDKCDCDLELQAYQTSLDAHEQEHIDDAHAAAAHWSLENGLRNYHICGAEASDDLLRKVAGDKTQATIDLDNILNNLPEPGSGRDLDTDACPPCSVPEDQDTTVEKTRCNVGTTSQSANYVCADLMTDPNRCGSCDNGYRKGYGQDQNTCATGTCVCSGVRCDPTKPWPCCPKAEDCWDARPVGGPFQCCPGTKCYWNYGGRHGWDCLECHLRERWCSRELEMCRVERWRLSRLALRTTAAVA
jgi:hypothetical protein